MKKYKKCLILFTTLIVCIFAVYSLDYIYGFSYKAKDKLVFNNEEKIVEGIREGLKKHYIKIAISFESRGNYSEHIEEIVKVWMEKALEPTGNPKEGDYLKYQIGNYKIGYKIKENKIGPDIYTIYIEPEYYQTLEQEAQVDEKVEDIIKEFGFDKDTRNVDKIQKIYSYLYNTVKYDIIHKKNDEYHLDSTAYATFIYQNASCQGFSVAFSRLLLEVGIDNRVITGYATDGEISEYHAWNLVELEGKYYNVDITWDKQTETNDFYLKCNDSFSSHKRDDKFMTKAFTSRYIDATSDY